MDKSSIEQKIKDRLSSHEEHIDNEALFSALGIEEKPNKRRFLWIPLFLLGIGAISLFFSLYSVNDDSTDLIPTLQNDEIVEINKVNIEQKNFKNVEDLEEAKSSSSQSIKEESTEDTNQLKQSSKKSQFNDSNGFKTQKIAQHLNDNSIARNIVPLNPTNENTHSKSVLEKDIQRNNLVTNEIKLENEVHSTLENVITFQKTNSENEIKISNLVYERNQIVNIKDRKIVSDFDIGLLASQSIKSLSNSIPTFQFSGNLTKIEIVEPSLKAKWSIVPYISYDKFDQSVFMKNENPQEYILVREQNEKELESLCAGIILNYSISKNLYGGIGFEFNQYNTQFKYSEFIYSTLLDSNSILRIDYFGDSTLIAGSGKVEFEMERKWTTYNELIVLNIPFQVGYNFNINKFNLFTEIGVQLGIYSQFNGSLYGENFEIIKQPQFYKSRTNLSMDLGAGANYKLSSKTYLYGKLRYRQTLNSLSSAQNPLNETIRQVGLNLGVRYSL